jgi:hypothetical protein
VVSLVVLMWRFPNLHIVGTELRCHMAFAEGSWTYAETLEYCATRNLHVKVARSMWYDDMTAVAMEQNSDTEDLATFLEYGRAYPIVCTAPRWGVDFVKETLRKEGIVATCNRPGDAMDTLDTRDDWWTRWQVATVATAIAGCSAHRTSKVVMVFLQDKKSLTQGSVVEWLMKEVVAEVMCTESGGNIKSVFAAVIDVDDFLRCHSMSQMVLSRQHLADTSNTVYLLRHGQSTANIGEDCVDPVLTSQGVGQATRLWSSLSKLGITDVLVSPMRRAVQTALLSGALQLNCSASLCMDAAEVSNGHAQNTLLGCGTWEAWARDSGVPAALIRQRAVLTEGAGLISLVAAPPFGRTFLVVTHFLRVQLLTGRSLGNGRALVIRATPAPSQLSNVYYVHLLE